MLIVSPVFWTGMTQRHRFSSLEEMAGHSLSRRRAPEKSCYPDIDELYRASLERAGVKDRLQIAGVPPHGKAGAGALGAVRLHAP